MCRFIRSMISNTFSFKFLIYLECLHSTLVYIVIYTYSYYKYVYEIYLFMGVENN